MIMPRMGLVTCIPVFHPFEVAWRSESVPDGSVTEELAMRNSRVDIAYLCDHGEQCPPYLLSGSRHQVKARPSGEIGGLPPGKACQI